MVVESWESAEAKLDVPLFVRGTLCERLRRECTSIHRRAHECLLVIGLEREERRVYLLVFGVLEVKYNLDRTGMKNK